MIKVKGFYSVPKLVNNSNVATATFGELSQYGASFSRDFKTYTRGTSQLNFFAFSVVNVSTKTELGTEYSSFACEVGDWIYTLGATLASTSSKAVFIAAMADAFIGRAKNITCGELVSDINLRMPAWVSWETDSQATSHTYKVWLTGANFESEYDDFEIFVVPPVDTIDKLFQPYPDLVLELAKNDMSVIHNRMSTIRNKFPETIVTTEMVELIDRTNTNNRVSVGWTTLIYGPAGNTTDNIKDAIAKYISDNSTNTESDWRLLMPDLFNTTCFYIVPRWEKYAIQPRLAMPGIFSPVVNAMENFNFVKGLTSSYVSTLHLTANLETTIHRYKDISLGIVGGEQNRLSLFKFTDYFPDYNAQESTNEDFNRQAQPTRDITTLLTLILKKIDEWEKDSSLPATVRVLVKYNQKFLVGKLNNVEFHVLMKPIHQP
jgi:hypothetical protein